MTSEELIEELNGFKQLYARFMEDGKVIGVSFQRDTYSLWMTIRTDAKGWLWISHSNFNEIDEIDDDQKNEIMHLVDMYLKTPVEKRQSEPQFIVSLKPHDGYQEKHYVTEIFEDDNQITFHFSPDRNEAGHWNRSELKILDNLCFDTELVDDDD